MMARPVCQYPYDFLTCDFSLSCFLPLLLHRNRWLGYIYVRQVKSFKGFKRGLERSECQPNVSDTSSSLSRFALMVGCLFRGLSEWEDKRCLQDANSLVLHGSYLSGLPPKRRRVFPLQLRATCDIFAS